MFRWLLSLSIALSVILPVGTLAETDLDEAWQALNDLRIVEARNLFEQHLDQHPKDPEALRGLILSAYFDFDHQLEVDMVREYIDADPGSPYLPAIFEYLASTMDEWAESNELTEQLARSLIETGDGALRYMGYRIEGSLLKETKLEWPEDRLETLGTCPGGWITGPFDNRTNIAAYRPLPIEGEPMDTLSCVSGKLGFRCVWTWLPADQFGSILPGRALEDEVETACQFRTYFSLPEDMEVVILLGGSFSGRVAIDGEIVHNDPLSRNAVQREGIRVKLSKGTHELAMVICQTQSSSILCINLLDAEYAQIEGLAWLRLSDVPMDGPSEATMVHPIFDPYDTMVADRPARPDDRYWWAMLKTYNGYADEVIESFENLLAEGDLSLLETWILSRALINNDESTKGTEYLGYIRQAVSIPLIDWYWNVNTAESYAVQINAHIVLDSIYPGRIQFEMMSALKPLLEGDIPRAIASIDKLDAKYPTNTSLATIKSVYYQSLLNDPESAYKEFLRACEKGSNLKSKLLESSGFLQELSKWKEAIECTQEAIKVFSHTDYLVSSLVNSHLKMQTGKEVIPLLDSLIKVFPSNIELYSLLHSVYSRSGELDKARDVLATIHRVKQAAVRPYVELDSLHNSVSYDEIFSSHDVMALWDLEPSEQERGPSSFWYILDSHKEIVFESGVVHSDKHWAIVLLDRDAVEQVQEIYLGFDNSLWFNKLLTARRLRKGQPPLGGQVDGNNVVFRDLQPGDAIEIHYRTWYARSGDLWKEYWNTYQVYSSRYQRKWEFTVLSQRDDINYSVEAPAGEPDISEHFGYHRLTWQGENYPTMNVDCAMAPPSLDLLGMIYVSSISDWNTIRHWYSAISEAIIDHNPRTVKLAREITAGLEKDEDKLRSLYDYVVQQIPYQVFQFSYDASIPHGPDQVLLNRWGDCKDKGHLLVAMLREVGLEAWPVLTMSRSEGTQLPLPQFAFDHLIAACVIDNDTLYVDATDIPFPPNQSITHDFAGQPFLVINPNDTRSLAKLHDAEAQGNRSVSTMSLSPSDDGHYAMDYRSEYYNLKAGYQRYDLRGVTPSELREQIETDYSASLGVTISIDSITHDQVEASDSVFVRDLYGQLDLNMQSFGNMTIVNMPDWSFVSKGLVPALVKDGKRDYLVDLRSFVGRYEKTIVLKTPEEFGQPQMVDPVKFHDSLLTFECSSAWDESTRTLRRSYAMEVQDGFCTHNAFEVFARKIMDAFDAPLVFSR